MLHRFWWNFMSGKLTKWTAFNRTMNNNLVWSMCNNPLSRSTDLAYDQYQSIAGPPTFWRSLTPRRYRLPLCNITAKSNNIWVLWDTLSSTRVKAINSTRLQMSLASRGLFDLSIYVKNVFYVFYSGHVFLRFLTFFILPTFLIFKNVHWKYHLKSLSKQRK